ncbi:hypothetical protein EV193_108264 [Herbihabitans rhizosphaerae]|uniref:DUF4352 domain-containing protein n=1 Tax=Herbihabitans rhizosphaerae TaxID=1872711 RepID=A0A4Q7KJV0_9PSEU|nr:hypothetical protein EV193_108264 [Herbihabitans rhizosphaerae]
MLVAGLATGCSSAEQPAPPPVTTYELPARTVRPDEKPLRVPPMREGETEFTLIGLTTGIETLIGSHAEWKAKGRYTRARLVIVNNGRTNIEFDARRQLLVLSTGGTAVPDDQAMQIKRQPSAIPLGAVVRVEFDLYYDIPVDAKPTALRVFGGPTLTDMKDAESIDIPLP